MNANDSITLTFDENVYANESELKTALIVTNQDGDRLPTSGYSVAVDTAADGEQSKAVTITILPGAESYSCSFTVQLANNVTLVDLAGNYANDFGPVTTEVLNVVSSADAQAAADERDVATAKATAEANTYGPVDQADVNTEATAKAAVEAELDALDLKGATYEIVEASFTPAQAGATPGDPGTNGSYKFKVKLTKGSAVATTTEETLTITATPGA